MARPSRPHDLHYGVATLADGGADPAAIGAVLGIVYRAIAAHLVRKARLTQKTGRTGAVTLIQRFGSALNLNNHGRHSTKIPKHPACQMR